jgi:hypothetical protein
MEMLDIFYAHLPTVSVQLSPVSILLPVFSSLAALLFALESSSLLAKS